MRVLICDTCGTVIPRRTAYRVGYATADVIVEWYGDDPRAVLGFTPEDSGVVRFDLCVGCAPEGSGLAAVMVVVVERVQ